MDKDRSRDTPDAALPQEQEVSVHREPKAGWVGLAQKRLVQDKKRQGWARGNGPRLLGKRL